MAIQRQLLLPDVSLVKDGLTRQALEDLKKALEELNRSVYGDLGGAATPAVPAIVLGTAAAAGTANSTVRTDATIVAFDATNPAALGTAAPGSAAVAARRDHVHTAPTSIPSGLISPYGGTSAPSGWLLCDGTAVSRTTYAALFTAISTNYGVGDGSTTFNVPDFRGRTAIGTGQGSGLTNRTIGATVGVETHALVEAELASHTHTGPSHTHTTPAHTHTIQERATGTLNNNLVAGTILSGINNGPTMTTGSPAGTAEGSGASGADGTGASGSAGSGTAHQNMPPSLVATYIIKT